MVKGVVGETWKPLQAQKQVKASSENFSKQNSWDGVGSVSCQEVRPVVELVSDKALSSRPHRRDEQNTQA